MAFRSGQTTRAPRLTDAEWESLARDSVVYRQKHNLSQYEMAVRAGFTNQAEVSAVECGRRQSTVTARKMKALIEADRDWALG